jgi:hypothetical protein
VDNQLDLSALTDDQLIGLLRAILEEAIRRHPAMEAAVRAAVLEESEKATIAKEAADREAAKIRALERQRVAEEAAARHFPAMDDYDTHSSKMAWKTQGRLFPVPGPWKM